MFPSSIFFFPLSIKLATSVKQIKCSIFVFPFLLISSITSLSLASKTIAETSLLIKEFSSSPICNPLSKGTDTIPPNILLK